MWVVAFLAFRAYCASQGTSSRSFGRSSDYSTLVINPSTNPNLKTNNLVKPIQIQGSTATRVQNQNQPCINGKCPIPSSQTSRNSLFEGTSTTGGALNNKCKNNPYDYNCAGLAFQTCQFLGDRVKDVEKVLNQYRKISCTSGCASKQYKFWYWPHDLAILDKTTGKTTVATPDFHIISGQTDLKGQGPTLVISKNGHRKLEVAKAPAFFEPRTGDPYKMNDQKSQVIHGQYEIVSNLKQLCYCSDTLYKLPIDKVTTNQGGAPPIGSGLGVPSRGGSGSGVPASGGSGGRVPPSNSNGPPPTSSDGNGPPPMNSDRIGPPPSYISKTGGAPIENNRYPSTKGAVDNNVIPSAAGPIDGTSNIIPNADNSRSIRKGYASDNGLVAAPKDEAKYKNASKGEPISQVLPNNNNAAEKNNIVNQNTPITASRANGNNYRGSVDMKMPDSLIPLIENVQPNVASGAIIDDIVKENVVMPDSLTPLIENVQPDAISTIMDGKVQEQVVVADSLIPLLENVQPDAASAPL
jgi:hypothetical protein